jgi:hypothetical protein
VKSTSYLFKGILVILIGSVALVTPVFYNTWVFLHSNTVSYSDLPAPKTTELYLIGTRHYPTSQFNSDTVYQYLEKIQPDLILMELTDRRFVGDRIKWMYRLEMSVYPFLRKYKTLESLGATKYVVNHPEVGLLPYEWDKAREVKKEIEDETRTKMMRALLDPFWGKEGTKEFAVAVECGRLNTYTKELDKLSSFNNNKNDSLIRRFIYLEFQVIPELVLANDSLSEFHDFAQKFKRYWPDRNRHMVENILDVIRRNPNKRIVVLTGFLHRYLLREMLSEAISICDFKLLDYRGESLAVNDLSDSLGLRE